MFIYRGQHEIAIYGELFVQSNVDKFIKIFHYIGQQAIAI
jgi:hypothetical protein